jgi:hypothetical protein
VLPATTVGGADALETSERVLVLRSLGLGDLLCAVPAMRAVRRRVDGCMIVATTPELVDLVRSAVGPDVVLPTPELTPIDLGRRAPPMLGIDLHGNGPASRAVVRGVLAGSRHGGLPVLAGFRRAVDVPDAWWQVHPLWDPDKHEVERWCRLVDHVGAAADRSDVAVAPDRPSPVNGYEPVTIVHPGAASPSRRWPAERFGCVVAALIAGGHRVVVTGGPGERALVRSTTRAQCSST